MDFSQFPIDIIHKILSSLTTTTSGPSIFTMKLLTSKIVDTKEALKTCILSKTFLQACSTLPDLNFSCKVSNCDKGADKASIAAERQRFANHFNQTLTRYQQNNISLPTLRLDVCVEDVYFANMIEELIRKAEECGVVQEIYLNLSSTPLDSNLVKSIFSHKKLVALSLFECDLSMNHCEFLINCSSLRTLELFSVTMDQCLLDNLLHSCPLIEGLQLSLCCKIEAIRIANLPNLKRLKVFNNPKITVDVDVPSLERMLYGGPPPGYDDSFYYLPNIKSTHNLKRLSLDYSTITDRQLHKVISNCPVLEKLNLFRCNELKNIKVSSELLRLLRLKCCDKLMGVNITAPLLTKFTFLGSHRYGYVLPSLAFTRRDSRKLSVILLLYNLKEFFQLSELLKSFKSSDDIFLTISYNGEFKFDNDLINNLRNHNKIIPEFEQVCITVYPPTFFMHPPFLRSAYSSVMEGLLASFSPKILAVKCLNNQDVKHYLCMELLLEDEAYNPCSYTRPSRSWSNYFKQVKLEGIDEDWQPLHSWKTMKGVLKNLGDRYIKLSRT